MGTHCQLQVTDELGCTQRVERTMDGLMLVDQIPVMIYHILDGQTFDALQFEDTIGNGLIELDEECEDNYEYLVVVNFETKNFGWSYMNMSKDMVVNLVQMIDLGWSIEQLDI